MAVTEESHILDEFTNEVNRLWTEHPLWRITMPPKVLGLLIHPIYKRRLLHAVSATNMYRVGETDRGYPCFELPMGRIFLREVGRFKRHHYGRRELRLVLRPERVFVARRLAWPRSVYVVETRPKHFADAHPVECEPEVDEDGWKIESVVEVYPPEAGVVKLWNRAPIVIRSLENSRQAPSEEHIRRMIKYRRRE